LQVPAGLPTLPATLVAIVSLINQTEVANREQPQAMRGELLPATDSDRIFQSELDINLKTALYITT